MDLVAYAEDKVVAGQKPKNQLSNNGDLVKETKLVFGVRKGDLHTIAIRQVIINGVCKLLTIVDTAEYCF